MFGADSDVVGIVATYTPQPSGGEAAEEDAGTAATAGTQYHLARLSEDPRLEGMLAAIARSRRPLQLEQLNRLVKVRETDGPSRGPGAPAGAGDGG